MLAPPRLDRTWTVEVACAPDDLWATLADTAAYRGWWPWLAADGLPPLETGSVTDLTIEPPLPYRLRVRVEVTATLEGRAVDVAVAGDLTGMARLRIEPIGPETCRALLDFSLSVDHDGLRRLPRATMPLLRLGHELVMSLGIRQFARATGLAAERRTVGSDSHAAGGADGGLAEVVASGLVAGAVAAVLSGAPSTAHAWWTRRSVLTSTEAAGTLLGRPGIARGLVAHAALSLGWGVVTAAVVRALPVRTPVATTTVGALVGAAIAALDLGVVAPRRFPAVADLPTAPQVADHLAFGATAALVARWSRRRRRGLAPAERVGGAPIAGY